jgi:type VI secretion system secreted protein VgrG
VQLKDYNYEYPDKNLRVETQLDAEAPGLFYDYGDHFKDESEGELLARVRNEEIFCANKIFRGKSDCRLFRPGFKCKLGGHYRGDWNEEFIITKVRSRGNQGGVFGIIPGAAKGIPTFENVFDSIPANKAYRPPRITPIPRLSGIMTAKVESSAGDEYAFIDDQGRYKIKVPFDLSDKTNGEASKTIRLSQPYSGGVGMHFPNHADTEIVWAFGWQC